MSKIVPLSRLLQFTTNHEPPDGVLLVVEGHVAGGARVRSTKNPNPTDLPQETWSVICVEAWVLDLPPDFPWPVDQLVWVPHQLASAVVASLDIAINTGDESTERERQRRVGLEDGMRIVVDTAVARMGGAGGRRDR